MIGGLLRRLVHLSIIIRKKKNQKTGAKRENGLQGDGMCFWKRICADGWVSETEQKESASTPDNWL